MKNVIFKRAAAAAICLSLVLSALFAGFDVPGFAPETAYAQQVRVTVDGVYVNFPDAQPIIIQGRTLVPARGVFEQMGFVGDWNPQTSTSTLSRQGLTVSMRSGDLFFTVNGVQQFPEVPPQLMGGRFMIPLRAVAEATGANVSWNENTRTVIITTGRPGPLPTPAPTPAPTTPTINIGNQVGTLTAGTAGTVDFPVMTQNIPNGTYQLAIRSAPAGVSLQSSNLNINNNSGTLRINGSAATQQGTFRVTISVNLGANRGWTDQDITLVISSAQTAEIEVSVGSQGGTTPVEGTAGSATFTITTRNLPNGNYAVSLLAPVPAGVSLASNIVNINNNSGTLTLDTTTATPHGVHPIDFTMTLYAAGGLSLNRRVNLTVNRVPDPEITNIFSQNPNPFDPSANWLIAFNIATQHVPAGTYTFTINQNFGGDMWPTNGNISIDSNGNGNFQLTTNLGGPTIVAMGVPNTTIPITLTITGGSLANPITYTFNLQF